MWLNVKPQTALNFTKGSVYFVSSWPPEKFKNKYDKFWFHFRWWLALVFVLCFLFTLLNGLRYHRDNMLKLINITCLSAAAIQAVSKLLICRMQWSRLQMLHWEMQKFIENANELQNEYLQKYINRSLFLHSVGTISMYLVSFAFIVEPIVQSQPFSTDGVYPFPITSKVIYYVIHVQRICSLLLISSALTIDFQVATLLWFTGIKFEILGYYCQRVSNYDELSYCVKKHQRILWFADEVKTAVRLITACTVATTTIGIICGCLALITNLPISVKFRISNIVWNAAIELFIYAWPGDNLIRVSEDLANKIYQSNWYKNSSNKMRSVVSIIQRSHQPVTITITGFIPHLSLQYYTSFLSATFKSFTTLRVIFARSEQ